MAMRLTSATGQPLAALALLAGLCACATTATGPSIETPPPGWRIVERTGEARYLPPDSAAWVAATTGQALAGGAEIATGAGGRLIVDAPGRHLSVGPDSRFVLPGEDPWLEQRAGWLRYRIAAAAHPFRIHTRSLELEVAAGVVDVHVNHLATDVTVKEGQVRVATPDGLRQTQMLAGQSARAGDADLALAVRLAPGKALQSIEPVVLPAIQPRPAPPGMAAATAPEAPPSAIPPAPGMPAPVAAAPVRAGAAGTAAATAREASPTTIPPTPRTSAPAVTAPVRVGDEPLVLRQPTAPARMRPQPRSNDPAAATAGLGHGADPALRATRVESADGRPAGAQPSVGATAATTSRADPAALRRSKFERLTAGALDGIESPQPARSEPGPLP